MVVEIGFQISEKGQSIQKVMLLEHFIGLFICSFNK